MGAEAKAEGRVFKAGRIGVETWVRGRILRGTKFPVGKSMAKRQKGTVPLPKGGPGLKCPTAREVMEKRKRLSRKE